MEAKKRFAQQEEGTLEKLKELTELALYLKNHELAHTGTMRGVLSLTLRDISELALQLDK